MRSLLMITALLLTMVSVNSYGFCMKEFMNQNTGRFADTAHKPDSTQSFQKQDSQHSQSGKAGRKW